MSIVINPLKNVDEALRNQSSPQQPITYEIIIAEVAKEYLKWKNKNFNREGLSLDSSFIEKGTTDLDSIMKVVLDQIMSENELYYNQSEGWNSVLSLINDGYHNDINEQ